MKNLALKIETVRVLSGTELDTVIGGAHKISSARPPHHTVSSALNPTRTAQTGQSVSSALNPTRTAETGGSLSSALPC